jgi:glycosyltransferase involved in cell wall biosynthesis
MLSILIPVYNYEAFPLVSEVHAQATKAGIPFEILCFDDASPQRYITNEQINTLEHARYQILETNIGRSKIRNLLAQNAQFDWLLFLDADVLPKNKRLVLSYLPYIDAEPKVVNGGILYQKIRPDKRRVFRWLYGTKREALSYKKRRRNPYLALLTLNFMIHKSVFSKVTFNEEIPNLRHEDTLFSYDLMLAKVPVVHIKNPVFHLGIDVFETAIRKENESLIALKFLIDHELVTPGYLRISKLFNRIKKLKLVGLLAAFHQSTKTLLLMNLSGKYPSLRIFDLYRIGYLCNLEKNSHV